MIPLVYLETGALVADSCAHVHIVIFIPLGIFMRTKDQTCFYTILGSFELFLNEGLVICYSEQRICLCLKMCLEGIFKMIKY